EPQRELVPPARIPQRDDAIHGLMAAPKIEGDRLANVEARIGMNRDTDGEAIDGERAPLPLRRRRPGRDGEDDRGNAENPAPDAGLAGGQQPPYARPGNDTVGTWRSSGRS